ncbi:MAG TPA: biopolymer transporter ExbD [Lacipirellulaceae bacterium]|nr:biopolymer transporter ExbD [Lacipirellulaceae bacterium]
MAGNLAAGYSDEEDGALSAINVTPLVDVTLVLLIVFMITVPVIVGSARVKVDVPQTTSVESDPETQLPLIFALKRNEEGKATLYLNDNPVTEAEVRKTFSGDRKFNQDQQVSLSADRGIAYGEVMKVVDLLESLGLKKLSLDTRHVEAPR